VSSQKEHYILISGKYWGGSAQNASSSMMEIYTNSIGFPPHFTFSFTLDKWQLYQMRLQLLKAVVVLGLHLKCDTAYFENYYSPILRYKEGQLELKTHESYCPPEELAKLPVSYSELAQLPTL
jgi:hypothetical protein